MNTLALELTGREFREIVARRLAQLTPPWVPTRRPGEPPRAVLIGGPEGAGKSTLQGLVHRALGVRRVVSYDLDSDLAAHPRYDQIMRTYGVDGQQVVRAHFPIGEVQAECLAHLREGPLQYDVITSHPLHDEPTARRWIDGFSDQGYDVTVVYIATHQSNCLQGMANRFWQSYAATGIGRWVEMDVVDQHAETMPATAHALELDGPDRIYVVNRPGFVVFENHRSGRMMAKPPGSRAAIVAECGSSPTTAERAQFVSQSDELLRHMFQQMLDQPHQRLPAKVVHTVGQARTRADRRPPPVDSPRFHPGGQIQQVIGGLQGAVQWTAADGAAPRRSVRSNPRTAARGVARPHGDRSGRLGRE